MKIRWPLALVLVVCGLLAWIAVSDSRSERASSGSLSVEPAKNLVVVCFDTVRYDSFWLPEQAEIKDDLSGWLEQALRLHGIQSTAPWTIPAVASLFTGHYPVEHGAGRFAQQGANLATMIPSPLPEGVPTLGEKLGDQGYRTGAFVSHPWFKPQFGLARGMEELLLWRGAENVVEHSLKWIGQQSIDQPSPFFAYLHFMEAHDRHTARYTPDDELDSRLAEMPRLLREKIIEQAPPAVCGEPSRESCKRYQIYLSSVMDLRAVLADLLSELNSRSLLEQTIVVLYADHGEEFHDHQQFGHGHSMYQELLKVPVVVWHPDLRRGSDSRAPLSLAELNPLLLRWLRPRRSTSTYLDASDLLATVPDRPRPLYSSGIAYGFEETAVKMGRWKRIRRDALDELVLFDLERDPHETDSIEAAEVAEGLDKLLRRYRAQDDLLRADVPVPLSREEIEHLKSLGYLDAL